MSLAADDRRPKPNRQALCNPVLPSHPQHLPRVHLTSTVAVGSINGAWTAERRHSNSRPADAGVPFISTRSGHQRPARRPDKVVSQTQRPPEPRCAQAHRHRSIVTNTSPATPTDTSFVIRS
jgi:hypothetical protein